MDPPNLSTEQEQIAHFRELAEELSQKNVDLQREFDDYTAASAQIEKELEITIDHKEKANRELRQQNQRLDRETEFLKKKIDRFQQECTQMENELKVLKTEKERHLSYIRELEQKNDDLERAQRVISESVAGIETLLHQAYEKNAVLENEVDELENLRVNLQRVTDEARDLKQELYVKDKIPLENTPNSALKKSVVDQCDVNKKSYNGHVGIDSNRLMETETQTTLTGTPLKLGDVTLNGNTLTPSSRISALNIVGDLLRKVGLERFLCPECSKVRCICPKSDKAASPVKEDTQNVHCNSSLLANNGLTKLPVSDNINISQNSIGSHSERYASPPRDFFNSPETPNQQLLSKSNILSTQNGNEKNNHSISATTSRNIHPKDMCINLFRNSSIRRSNIAPKPPPRSPTKGRPNGLESKLASCRAPAHNRDTSHGSSDFTKDPYRMRKLSIRGPSSPAVTPNYIH